MRAQRGGGIFPGACVRRSRGKQEEEREMRQGGDPQSRLTKITDQTPQTRRDITAITHKVQPKITRRPIKHHSRGRDPTFRMSASRSSVSSPHTLVPLGRSSTNGGLRI